MSGAREKTALQDGTLPEQDVLFGVWALNDRFAASWEGFFAEHGITPQQYNVLRILYVRAPEEGMACGDIGKRLISRVPDVTRLLDRLERQGLIERQRDPHDRRQVKTRLTDKGFRLVEEIHPQTLARHQKELTHLTPDEVRSLGTLLKKAIEALDAHLAASTGNTK